MTSDAGTVAGNAVPGDGPAAGKPVPGADPPVLAPPAPRSPVPGSPLLAPDGRLTVGTGLPGGEPQAVPLGADLRQLRSLGRLRGGAALFGPAFVAAVAYVDPGNFATNFSAGAASRLPRSPGSSSRPI